MKLAFYKAEFGDLYDKSIAWWTRPNKLKIFDYKSYSHVEMYFSDGTCFSSSPRDGGTRWKIISDIETSGKWDFIELPFVNERCLSSLCDRQLGKEYDWLCIFFSFLLPFEIEDPGKWICSEICGKLPLNLEKAFKYSPNLLYEYSKSIV